jgi:molecular chaperone GrpE
MTKEKKDEHKEEPKKEEQPGDNAEKTEELPSITISYEELDSLQKQLADLQAQSNEYLNGLQRERADFANYKRRIDQENQNTYNLVLAEVVKPFLVVVDDLDRALKHCPTEDAYNPWVDGIALILQKLLQVLESQGVERLQVNPGDEFDPLQYEAITHEENPDYANGQIIEVLQAGYKIKDRIIRPALVRVAK